MELGLQRDYVLGQHCGGVEELSRGRTDPRLREFGFKAQRAQVPVSISWRGVS